MDLRIPAALETSGTRGPQARPARHESKKSDAPERDPIADKLVVDADLLKQVEAALSGKADMPEIKKQKNGEPMATVRFLPQDDVLPDRTEEIPQKEVGADLSGTRFKTMEDPSAFRPPTADKDGNYIFSLGDPRQGAVNAYVSAYKALNIAEKYLGRKVDWGFDRKADGERLWIHPHAGEGMNAFYNNKNGSINFLYAEDPRSKELIDTSASMEVVAHETGHAILDGMRHKYIDSLDTSSGGFHEAFGDCIAMLASLSDDDVVEQLYQETRGNLSKPNIISNMGEQLGRAMRGPNKEYVRSALNDHTYRDPHFLPYIAFPDGPALEVHANSQVYTAATYDLLRLITHEKTEDSKKPFTEAVKESRDTLGKLLMRSLEFAPLGKITYKDAAMAMLKADMIDNKGENMKSILTTFTARGIFNQDDANKFMTDVATTKLLSKAIELPADFDAKKGGKAFLAENAELLDLSSADLKSLKYDKMVTNDRGEKILHYTEAKDFELTGPEWGAQFQGSSYTINGGLLLAFDKDNKLIAVTRDPITEDNKVDAELYLKKMIDFQKNPPVVIRGGGDEEDAAKKGDPHLEFMLASTRQPVEVVNGEIRKSGILYCGDEH